jgi:hypothetical protein
LGILSSPEAAIATEGMHHVIRILTNSHPNIYIDICGSP